MDEETSKRIRAECGEFTSRLCEKVGGDGDAMLFIATCLLLEVRAIHEVIGGAKLHAAILYANADDASRTIDPKGCA